MILAQRLGIIVDIALIVVNIKRRPQVFITDGACKREERTAFIAARCLGVRLDFVSAFAAMHDSHRNKFLLRLSYGYAPIRLGCGAV
jgi:hypothetical protein